MSTEDRLMLALAMRTVAREALSAALTVDEDVFLYRFRLAEYRAAANRVRELVRAS